MSDYCFDPPPIAALAIVGERQRFPVFRLFFVGRNYHAHAREMGSVIDKATARPFYFTKSALTLTPSGATIAYPPATQNFHYEMELVVAVGKAGFRIPPQQAHEHIYGYAAGLDMTRRDLQTRAREQGKPWDLGKDVEHSSVCSAIVARPAQVLTEGEISLALNAQIKQQANIRDLIWDVREIIADLSQYYHLQAGDLIYTGTPEGVGPVQVGDHLSGRIEGLAEVSLHIGSQE